MSPLLITYGMGIGPEVSLKALLELGEDAGPVVLVGRRSLLLQSMLAMNMRLPSDVSDRLDLSRGDLPGLANVSVHWTDYAEEPPEVAAIRWSAEQCAEGKGSALVTGPIHKARLIEQGFSFKGHTDFLSDIFKRPVVMSFVGGDFRVALVTAHIPLMEVGPSLSAERVVETVKLAAKALASDLGMSPRFGVCGLNPHAGEGGVLGREELEIINPACDELRNSGYSVLGAISAETAFQLASHGEIDMIVAMYHDQGLAPLKAVDFGRSVNWTLGLPIIRTSVDHGTADHLVGTGKARHESMISAIVLARSIYKRRSLLADQSSKSLQLSHT